MVIKNLENKIKLVMIVCSLFLVGCIVISLGSVWTARGMVSDAQKKVYVLDSNVPVLVKQTTMEETLDVEAKSHIDMFHHYFFTLAPDDKYIKYTMEKAMYLVDETGLAQYNALKEKGLYSNIMGTSAVFSIFCDSIRFDDKSMEFTYYGRQRIERRTSILTRELVTAGVLKRVPRTENNPHGLLITNWRTLLNKDIEQKDKVSKLLIFNHINDIMSLKAIKRMIKGEPMPDVNDPKNRERREREINAGRKFALKSGIARLAACVQRFAENHRVLFMTLALGIVIGCFTFNVVMLVRMSGRGTASGIELQDSLIRQKMNINNPQTLKHYEYIPSKAEKD